MVSYGDTRQGEKPQPVDGRGRRRTKAAGPGPREVTVVRARRGGAVPGREAAGSLALVTFGFPAWVAGLRPIGEHSGS